MLQHIRLNYYTFVRKWKKFRSDPEKFFLDSGKPVLPSLGRWIVSSRQTRAAQDEGNGQPGQGRVFPLAPIHVCPDAPQRGIFLVIPIHNAPDQVEGCLRSVLRYTGMAHRILLIDDASTDPRIEEILGSLPDDGRIEIIRNRENLGFVKTVNKGISRATEDDVVLVNSDIEVGPGWLEGLHVAAYQDADIATATPLSNNAGAFSAPSRSRSNQLPEGCSLKTLSRSIRQDNPGIFLEAPTGNGFCMYMRREAIEQIGYFDDQAYPRGYCEENDWCQRAMRSGWRHAVDGRTYVLHHHAASFGSEKKALLRINREVLDQRFPDYTAQVHRFLRSREMERLNEAVGRVFSKVSQNGGSIKPRILYVISSETGGTPQTNTDLMRAVRDEYAPYLLVCNSRTVKLKDCSGPEQRLLEEVKLNEPVRAPDHTSSEYDRLIGHFLIKYAIELVHIRHVSWHSLNLPRVAKSLNIPVIKSFHDYYTVCPNTQLIDSEGRHCAGRCTDSSADCEAPLWGRQEKPRLKQDWVFTWRERMREVLDFCDGFVTTTQSAKAILTGSYPELEQKPFPIIPHGRDFESFLQPDWLFEPSEKIRLACPGNLNKAKGLELILELKDVDTENCLEIHLLGKVATAYQDKLGSKIAYQGPYKRGEFQKCMRKIRPHCIGLFSLWPETYSHTLTEAWAAGVPVFVTPFGALKERVEQYGGGWVLPSLRPEEIYRFIRERMQDMQDMENKLQNIRKWQSVFSHSMTVENMAKQYKDLYRQCSNFSLFSLNF